jgi:uncharacterized protein (TIGR00251 family)
VSDDIVLDIKLIPRAGATTLAGMRDGAVLIRVAAAPVEGAANLALVAFLADLLGIPKRNVVIVSGDKSRRKRVKISGVTAEVVQQALQRR